MLFNLYNVFQYCQYNSSNWQNNIGIFYIYHSVPFRYIILVNYDFFRENTKQNFYILL